MSIVHKIHLKTRKKILFKLRYVATSHVLIIVCSCVGVAKNNNFTLVGNDKVLVYINQYVAKSISGNCCTIGKINSTVIILALCIIHL